VTSPAQPAVPPGPPVEVAVPRRWLVQEVWLVFALSLGTSGLRALLHLLDDLTSGTALRHQAAVLNGSQAPGRPWLDLALQLTSIAAGLVPVLLAAHLLTRSGESLRTLGLDAGQAIAVVRFESEDAARRNSDRPEQDAWWTQTSKVFTEEPTFIESDKVDVDLSGNPDDAGFVQVIQGHSSDPARARELMAQDPDAWAAFRPDIVGSVGIGHDGDAYTVVLYFTSEAAAREGEKKETPPELQAQMDEMGKLEVGEPTFLDLRDPWMHSPASPA